MCQELSILFRRIQLLRKQVTPPTPVLPPATCPDDQTSAQGRSFPQAFLGVIHEGDGQQLRVLFDTIDKNKDGFLSAAELEEFAKNLR